MTEKKFYYRESLISLLRSIAAETSGNSFSELVCSWFDDLYMPGSDPVLYKPGVHERGMAEFNSCFRPEELQSLERFHRYFDEQLDRIPDGIGPQELVANEHWQGIRQEATKILEVFNSSDNEA